MAGNYPGDGSPSIASAFYNLGTALGQNLSVGTADNYQLTIITNGTAAMTIDTSQNVTVAGSLTVTGATIFTGVIEAPNGTAAAPSVTFASDLDTGMYRIGANTIGLATNGTLGLTLSSAQNVIVAGSSVKIGGGAIDTTSALNVASAALTSASQTGVYVAPVYSSAATTGVADISSASSSAAASFMMPYHIAFLANAISLGSGSSVTRDILFFGVRPTTGTNNAVLADNTSFTSNWFINQSGTDASKFAGVIQLPDGAVGAPGVTFSGDTDTGVYRIGANDMGFATNGALSLEIKGLDVVVGSAALANAATSGFLWLPSTTDDVPSGTPANTFTGRTPVVFDATHGRLYAYYGGAWKYAAVAT